MNNPPDPAFKSKRKFLASAMPPETIIMKTKQSGSVAVAFAFGNRGSAPQGQGSIQMEVKISQ
jgi:hypothetical protein